MMLVQKPSQFPSHPHSMQHRRHPSAPVIVQPTRTPGLLSLSMAPTKPSTRPQQQHQQQQRQHRSPRSKPAAAAAANTRSPKPTHVPAEAQAQASEADKKLQQPTAAGPSPDKQHVRGRQQANKAAKDKMTRRSASPSIPLPPTAQGRRNNTRQPSPVLTQAQVTSQAEALSFANNKSKTNSNLFDPFVVSSDSDSDNNSADKAPRPAKGVGLPTPKLASNPSGKLARRRQPGTPTPAPSKAVPVPRNNKGHAHTHSAMMNLSRSAPMPSASPASGGFPICDDTDVDGMSPPVTPTKSTWQQTLLTYDDGPRTAPLSSTTGFPFGPSSGMSPTATPSPTRHQRHHVRSPSEGVFSMSFDEDSSSSSDASEELKMLFGLMPKRNAYVPTVRAPAGMSAKAKASLYASSLFQNSPSPDELPPPAF